VNKHRPKHNFTSRDLTRILLTLWTQDDLIFIPERYRVQLTFIIRVYCWTGARLSAFFTGRPSISEYRSRAATHIERWMAAHLQHKPEMGEEQPRP
jgi:hypothetical protein